MFAHSALQVGKTVLVQILESLAAATSGEALDLSGEGSQRHILTNPHYSQQRMPKFIEAQQVLDTEIPAPSAAQVHKLIIESVCSFVDNFILIFDQHGFKIGASKGTHKRSQTV